MFVYKCDNYTENTDNTVEIVENKQLTGKSTKTPSTVPHSSKQEGSE